MTTGSWFILFTTTIPCEHCATMASILDALSADEEIAERGIILATMNVPISRKTAVRLNIEDVPTLLYFHRGQLYHFDGEQTLAASKTFLLKDVDQMLGSPIPSPLSSLDLLLQEITMALHDYYNASVRRGGVVGTALVILPFMFILLVASLVTVCLWPSSVNEHYKES